MTIEDQPACTAQRNEQGDLPNPLFTPPCECPACAAEPPAKAEPQSEKMWLTVRGRPVRFDVDQLQLGERSQQLL